MCDYENAKAVQDKISSVGELRSRTGIGTQNVSRVDILEKQANMYQERAERAQKAAKFLRDHPEFIEFMILQREGAFEY